MGSTGAGYDLSSTTFSPDGRVFQVEYAQKAIEKSSTAIGIKCVDGVVLGAEKLIGHKMLKRSSNRKLQSVSRNAGMALAGLAADARKLVSVGRDESHEYLKFYGTPIPGKTLAKRIAAEVHTYTLYWYLRPFGASVLLGTFDADGPELYVIDPTGTGFRYFASAIGKQKAGAETELEKIDFSTVTCREAVAEIAKMFVFYIGFICTNKCVSIYKLHDDIKDKDFELEMSWICEESGREHHMIPEDLLKEAVAAAIAAKEHDDMDESSDEE